MKIGFIGLGRMGKAIVEQLLEKGVEIVLYNRTKEKTDAFIKENHQSIIPSYSYREFLEKQESPRIVFLMVDHGPAVDEVIDNLEISGLKKDDIVIDGGNSFYKDSIRRYARLKKLGVNFLDIGTSGGIEGARTGACLMVGGDLEIFEKVKPTLEKMSIPGGLTYFGIAGSGHFVKMVHNGVEYGMLQALGEGFEILSKKMNKVDLSAVAQNWKHGSVVRGWLVDLLARALDKDPTLKEFSGSVGGGSTGEWTVETAKELMADVPVITASLEARKKSKTKPSFAGKVVGALRREFGGHID